LQSEPVKKLQAFAEKNKETQGKFTIGDEKVSTLDFSSAGFEGFG
jgi:hydroxyacylglutathione hydrolase